MRHKVGELEDHPLNAAVALCEGHGLTAQGHIVSKFGPFPAGDFLYNPSVNEAQGGPIVEREGIAVTKRESKPEGMLPAIWHARVGGADALGPTRLVAAMRAYVASRYGDEIDLP